MPLVLIALIALMLLTAAQAQGPQVTVQQGVLLGKTELFQDTKYANVPKNIDVFLGIPFADPPNRFEAPEAKRSWPGVWNATYHRPACMQTPIASFYYPAFMDEDCLYLNIFVPSSKPQNATVMVWIHGGGFETGTAMTYDYYGLPLAAVGDVIIVVPNYRLGVFGFLATADDTYPGNYGMLDQVAALVWVKDNIEAFGGDKNRITLFGESAGAASVSFHLLSKLSRGLFQQAILQSGSALSNFGFRSDRRVDYQSAESVGEALGCNRSTSLDMVACLKQVNAGRLRSVADSVYPGYSVSVDGHFLEDTPYNLYAKGDFQHATILTGFNEDEGTIRVFGENLQYAGRDTGPSISLDELRESVTASATRYGIGDDILIEAILHQYINWTKADDVDADFLQELINFHGDFDFICPTNEISRLHSVVGDTVFQYYMTHDPSMYVTQFSYFFLLTITLRHLEELTFVWGLPFIKELDGVHVYNLTSAEKALSVDFMTMWTNFAKTGNPSETWPKFTLPELRYKILSPRMGEGRAARAQQCHFWSQYLLRLLPFTDADIREL
ncbi:cholinesterase-like [Diadema antillarum]|uniref:cholinesterase-like n=1 Tax=Diadema antillarum TaxID=105358 RepID=UPI003A8479FA